jgi:dUTP pyrophosphatase
MIKIKRRNVLFSIKKLKEDIKLPIKGHLGDAGFDVFSIDEVIIPKGKTIKIPLGFATEIPDDTMLMMCDKSGIATKGIHAVASIIDSTYRGELHAVFTNTTDEDYKFEAKQKVAQMILFPCYTGIEYKVVTELSDTSRGSGGFGSTGLK